MKQDVLTLDGRSYVSVRRAAEITGYTRDYVGQLSRQGKIVARRVGKAWFVDPDSIIRHKEEADMYVPHPPEKEAAAPVETIVGLDGKEYISAKRAAEISGYNHDYITSMARDAKLCAQQIAGRWYVAREDLLAHKRESDAQMAAVHVRSSGLEMGKPAEVPRDDLISRGVQMSYHGDARPVLPVLVQKPVPERGFASTPIVAPLSVHASRGPMYDSNYNEETAVSKERLIAKRGQMAVAKRDSMQLMIAGAIGVLILALVGSYALGAIPSQTATVAHSIEGILETFESVLGARVSHENTI